MRECRKCSNLFEGRQCMVCHKAYYVKNAEKVKARRAEIRAQNREAINEKVKAYRQANPEKIRQIKERHAKKHSEKIVERVRLWRLANPNAKREQSHNYRAKKRHSGKISLGLAERLFKLQKGRCACCGEKLGDDYHMDHIVPIARGGQNIDSNMQLLTRLCNLQKNAKDPIDFMQQRGFLL